jgi:hypothetical protein
LGAAAGASSSSSETSESEELSDSWASSIASSFDGFDADVLKAAKVSSPNGSSSGNAAEESLILSLWGDILMFR